MLDNWGNGGGDFTRNIPFDKLHGVMTKAQVDEARAAGRLLGETRQGFILASEAPRQIHAPKEKTAEEKGFEALRDAAKAGVQVVAANQLFPTPPEIAAQVVELAGIRSDQDNAYLSRAPARGRWQNWRGRRAA